MSQKAGSKVEVVLYAIAGLTGSIAVLFLAFSVQFPVSPVSKFVLLAVVGVWIIVGGQFAETQAGVVAAYGVGVVSWISGGIKLIELLSLGSVGIVILLGAVALLFAGLARWVRSGKLQPLANDRRRNALIAGGGAVVLILVLGVDALSGGVTFTLTTVGTIQQTPADGDSFVQIGTLEARNNGVLPYNIDEPRYEACLVGNWSVSEERFERPLRVNTGSDSPYNGQLGGGETVQTEVELLIPRSQDGEPADLAGVPVVQQDSCPDDDGGQRRIVIYEAESGRIGPA